MKQYILDFKKSCDNWNSQASPNNIQFIFNNSLNNINKNEIKCILVADNPGTTEKEKEEYLVGDSGLVTRLFFDKFIVDDFDKQVLVLNKTPISTPTTKQLEKLHITKCNAFINSQRYMANLIFNLSVELKCPTIIMGFSGCRTNGKWPLTTNAKKAVGLEFFKQLKVNYENHKEFLYIIKHFSRNSFFDDFKIEHYRNEANKYFFELGAKYRNELFNS